MGITPGDAHRQGKKGRPHALDDPEFAKEVAEAFVAGQTRAEMCDLFSVKDPATITRWRRDPRVKAITQKLIEDRVLAITRRTDSVIEARLAEAENMTIRELLDIRKEFLGGALRQQTEKADAETTGAALEALEQNPDLGQQLADLVSGGKPASNTTAAQREAAESDLSLEDDEEG